MILAFNSLIQAQACADQIHSGSIDILVGRGLKRVGNEIEIKAGKQRIERWAIPVKSATTNKWWIESPSERYAEDYAELVNGHTFEALAELPTDWLDNGDL